MGGTITSGLLTLMMLLRRGAAFTESSRTASVSWPPPGRMTPLRRPRDTLGGMKSGAPSPLSPSPFPSRSDMSARGGGLDGRNTGRGKKQINQVSGSDSNKVCLGCAWMPFRAELGLFGFLRSSSDRQEETNRPNLINYEQILIVSEHRAALTSGCRSALVSTGHYSPLHSPLKSEHHAQVLQET